MAFSQIKGHSSQIDFLINSFQNNRIAQSYLFAGQEGIGKSLIAKNFAKLLNCEGEDDNGCCDVCSSCFKTERGVHPDILYVKGEAPNSIKIEQIRDLKRFFSLAPYEAKHKIAIIDGAQFLTIEASNSLLKVLEEPNKSAILILIATAADKLLPTVVSRCQVIRFKNLPSDILSSILCDEYNFSREDAQIYINYSNGSLGMVLRLKEEDFISLRKDILMNIFNNKRNAFAKQLFSASGNQDLKRIVFILLTLIRDSAILKSSNVRSCLINIDYCSQIEEFFKYKTTDEVLLALGNSIEIYNLIDKNINKRLIIENLLNFIAPRQNTRAYN